MTNPKFSIGEAVMVRNYEDARDNCDFSVVLDMKLHSGRAFGYDSKGHRRPVMAGHWYKLSTGEPNESFHESVLHPIPPEKQNGKDAKQYIDSLVGVNA